MRWFKVVQLLGLRAGGSVFSTSLFSPFFFFFFFSLIIFSPYEFPWNSSSSSITSAPCWGKSHQKKKKKTMKMVTRVIMADYDSYSLTFVYFLLFVLITGTYFSGFLFSIYVLFLGIVLCSSLLVYEFLFTSTSFRGLIWGERWSFWVLHCVCNSMTLFDEHDDFDFDFVSFTWQL